MRILTAVNVLAFVLPSIAAVAADYPAPCFDGRAVRHATKRDSVYCDLRINRRSA
jgi:hypothetical protein